MLDLNSQFEIIQSEVMHTITRWPHFAEMKVLFSGSWSRVMMMMIAILPPSLPVSPRPHLHMISWSWSLLLTSRGWEKEWWKCSEFTFMSSFVYMLLKIPQE